MFWWLMKKKIDCELVEWPLICRDLCQHSPEANTDRLKQSISAVRASGGLSGNAWWRHQMERFSTLLVICAGNSPVTSEFPAQRPVTRSFGVLFDQHLNKGLSKQSWCWWFETPSIPFWRHCNAGDICCACDIQFMITSWHGEVLRISGHLLGESIWRQWNPFTKGQ